MKTYYIYTAEERNELLRQQRELCADHARMKLETMDGIAMPYINNDSILNAPSPQSGAIELIDADKLADIYFDEIMEKEQGFTLNPGWRTKFKVTATFVLDFLRRKGEGK